MPMIDKIRNGFCWSYVSSVLDVTFCSEHKSTTYVDVAACKQKKNNHTKPVDINLVVFLYRSGAKIFVVSAWKWTLMCLHFAVNQRSYCCDRHWSCNLVKLVLFISERCETEERRKKKCCKQKRLESAVSCFPFHKKLNFIQFLS